MTGAPIISAKASQNYSVEFYVQLGGSEGRVAPGLAWVPVNAPRATAGRLSTNLGGKKICQNSLSTPLFTFAFYLYQ